MLPEARANEYGMEAAQIQRSPPPPTNDRLENVGRGQASPYYGATEDMTVCLKRVTQYLEHYTHGVLLSPAGVQ